MTKFAMTLILIPLALLAAVSCGGATDYSDSGGATEAPGAREGSDPQAVAIAEKVLRRLGGRKAWDNTRYLRWHFYGERWHYWDRQTGDVRIVQKRQKGTPKTLVLMNLETKRGRVWEDGDEVEGAERLAELLQRGHEWWVNDSYWMFMPFKMLDPGVNLSYVEETTLPNGHLADVISLTFDDVGYTPHNRYDVTVDRETNLVVHWAYYKNAGDAERKFGLPWSGWMRFGDIWLSTEHGQEMDWRAAVYDDLPRSVFESPDDVK